MAGHYSACLALCRSGCIVATVTLQCVKMCACHDLSAAALSLDAIDISGSHEDDNTFSLTHDGDIHKIRLSGNGKRLGEYVTPKQQWGPFMMRRPQEVRALPDVMFYFSAICSKASKQMCLADWHMLYRRMLR